MKLKKLIALAMALLIAFTAVACGTTEQPKETAAPTQAQTPTEGNAPVETEAAQKDYSDITLRVAWWGGDARNTQTLEMLEDFANKYYPGLKVEVEYAGFGDYFTRLTTQATAGTLPDVYMMNDSKLVEFANGGVMEDLGIHINSGVIDVTNVSEGALFAGQVNGTQYAMSTGSNATAMFYDPAALEAAGATMSIQPTWSEFLAAAETVYNKTGQQAMVTFYTGSNQVFDAWLRSQGKMLFNEELNGFGFTAEDYAEYLEFVYDVLQKEYIYNGTMYEGENFAKMNGNIWADISGEASNVLGSHREGSAKELKPACFPIADNATTNGAYLKPAMLWALASNSEHKDIGAAFINYFMNETYPYEVAGLDRGVPVSSEICAYLESAASPVDAEGISFVNTIGAEGLAGPSARYPLGMAEANRFLSEVSEKLCYEQLAKEDILAAAQKAVDAGNEVLKNSN